VCANSGIAITRLELVTTEISDLQIIEIKIHPKGLKKSRMSRIKVVFEHFSNEVKKIQTTCYDGRCFFSKHSSTVLERSIIDVVQKKEDSRKQKLTDSNPILESPREVPLFISSLVMKNTTTYFTIT
jgi:hypothetical protein